MPVNVRFLGANVLLVIALGLATTTDKDRLSDHGLLCTSQLTSASHQIR
jgi:hypothetical protein